MILFDMILLEREDPTNSKDRNLTEENQYHPFERSDLTSLMDRNLTEENQDHLNRFHALLVYVYVISSVSS